MLFLFFMIFSVNIYKTLAQILPAIIAIYDFSRPELVCVVVFEGIGLIHCLLHLGVVF